MGRRQAQIAKPSVGGKTGPNRASPPAVKQDAPVPFTSAAGNQAANAVVTSAARQSRDDPTKQSSPRLANPGASAGTGSLVHSAVGGRSPEKAHERGTKPAVARSTAKASSVRVSGGKTAGVTRQPKDETKRKQPGPATKPDAPLAAKDPAGSLPKEDAARALQPGPEYWLSHSPDPEGMGATRLFDEFNQVDEWIKRQTATTPDLARLEQVRDQLQSEKDKRQKRTEDAGKKMPKRAAKAAGNRGKKTDDRAATDAPRILRERSSIATTEAGDLRREYDDIAAYLERKDVAPDDRKLLQTELANLGPALAQHLMGRSAERHAEVISRALTPDASSGDAPGQLVEAVRRVKSISPISGHPGLNYLMHGHEMIVIPDATADVIRANTAKSLDQMAWPIHDANKEVLADYDEFVNRTFEKHPIVGAISMALSGENPLDWDEKLMPMVRASNIQWQQFSKLRRTSKDPWNTDRPDLLPMAEKLAAAQRLSDNARNYLEYKTDQVLSATADVTQGLERLQFVDQLAASLVFTPAGAALFGAGTSALQQNREIAYGQREGYDFKGIAINAASSYLGGEAGGFVGGKLGKGVLSLGGESAPVWLRGAARVTEVVAGGRVGAAATTALQMAPELFSGKASASEYAAAIGHEAVDVKGSVLDLAMGALGHTVSSRARPSSSRLGRKLLVQPPPRRLPTAVSPASPAAEVGKTSGPTGPADVPTALGQSPPTTETHPRSAADVAPTPSSAGNVRPTSRSAPTRLGTRVLEAVIRGRLQADPSVRGIPGGDFKPTPALTEHTAPKAGGLSTAETPDASPPLLPAAEHSTSPQVATEPATTPKVTPAVKTTSTVTPPTTEPAPFPPKTREWTDFLPKAREITARAKAAYGDALMMMAGSKAGGSPSGAKQPEVPAKGKQDPNTASGKDPLVVAFIAGKRKGAAWPEGTPEFDAYAGSKGKPPDRRVVVLPSEAAKDLGFHLVGTERDTSIIPRTDEHGGQLESLGAGRTAKHNITARTSRNTSSRKGGGKLDAFQAKKSDPIAESAFHRTTAADRAGAHGYNELLNNKEIGILRPGNISTGGVDAITAEVKDGKARIFLNDFTTPDQPKPTKKSHNDWAAELGVAAATERLKTGNEANDMAIAQAIKDGEIYVRSVRVDLSPQVRTAEKKGGIDLSGGGKVEINDPVKVSRTAVAKAQAAKRRADQEARAMQRRAEKAAAGESRPTPTGSKKTGPQGSKPAAATKPKPTVKSASLKTSSASTPGAVQTIERQQKTVPATASKVTGQSGVPRTVDPVERNPATTPVKDDSLIPVDPSSARGDRVTDALGEPNTVLGAVRDYQQYKAEGRSEAEALSRSAITLAANLRGGPAGTIVNTADPDQQLPATKQIIKDKWNKLWS